MKKSEWQKHYEFSDGDMIKIETLLKLFNGKIINILDKPVLTSYTKAVSQKGEN